MRALVLSLVLLVASSSFAAEIVVTNTNDSGPGSLRDAIERASMRATDCGPPCTIVFNIAGPVPAQGWFTIRPRTPLPIVGGNWVSIDGLTQTRFTGDTNPFGPEIELDGSDVGLAPGLKFMTGLTGGVRDLAIHSFGGSGVIVEGGREVHVGPNNFIGVDPTGSVAKPNGRNGVLLVDAVYPHVRSNIISANAGNGIYSIRANARIYDNSIGTGRRTGIALGNGANGVNVIGTDIEVAQNRIAYNRDHGIAVGGRGVLLFENEIWGNRFLAIDLDNDGVDGRDALDADEGANGKLNAPSLTFAQARHGAITVRGSVQTKAGMKVMVSLFAAPYRSNLGLGDARIHLGIAEVTTDEHGRAEFVREFPELFDRDARSILVPGGFLVATITTAEGTSELSEPLPLAFEGIEVTTTADSGPGSLRAAIESANAATCSERARCWITFRVPGDARFTPASPLPVLTQRSVHIDGRTQEYWFDDRADGPDVQLSGTNAGAGAIGLRIGTDEARAFDVLVRELAVRDFRGDGVVVRADEQRASFNEQSHVLLESVVVEDNGGNGIVLFGGRRYGGIVNPRPNGVWRSIVRGNAGDGIVINGDSNAVRATTIVDNRGNGVFVRGALNAVLDSIVTRNGASGVAAAPEARSLFVDSLIWNNGADGIERSVPNDATEADGVTDAPELISATYDAARKLTIVRGRMTTAQANVPLADAHSGTEIFLRFYQNADADREGEAHVLPFRDAHFWVRVDGGEFEAEIPADLRGRFITATRTLRVCYFEFGCFGRDTSEYSNAVAVP